MDPSIKWILTIIIIMGTIIYLNQEVPACVDNPIEKNVQVQLNYSTPEVENLNTQLASSILVFETSGDSMYPLIKDQQKCVCMKSDSYTIGDIVVFFADLEDGFTGIAHQIISTDGENITTKGINNELADNPIKQENVLCKIATIPRYKLYG